MGAIMGAAALGLGLGQTALGLITGASAKKKSKRAIEQAYAIASKRMGQEQTYGREASNESLIGRGIQTGGGMERPTTLGAQEQSDLEREYGLQRADLLAQKNAALAGVDTSAMENTVSSIGSGIGSLFSAYNLFNMGNGVSPTNLKGLPQAPTFGGFDMSYPSEAGGGMPRVNYSPDHDFGINAVNPLSNTPVGSFNVVERET